MGLSCPSSGLWPEDFTDSLELLRFTASILGKRFLSHRPRAIEESRH